LNHKTKPAQCYQRRAGVLQRIRESFKQADIVYHKNSKMSRFFKKNKGTMPRIAMG